MEKVGKGVPYLEEDSIRLPQIDFEVVANHYNIIDDWKNRDGVVDKKMMHNANIIATTRKRQQAKKPNKQTEDMQKDNKTSPAKKEKENRWNNVFERLKGLF